MAMLADQMQQECRVPLSLHSMIDSAELAESADSAVRVGERKSFQPYHSKSVPKQENLQAKATARAGDVTTMMLRNIPNKYTQTSLLQEIDDCGFVDSYNFFYLPMDVHNCSNVGYAFINFVLPQDADRFCAKFSDHRFQRFQSRKISSVCTAHVQGLDANLNHFKNRAVTHAKNGQYRPVVLKNNVRVDFEDALAEANWSGSPALPAVSAPPAAPVELPLGLAAPPGLECALQGEMGVGCQDSALGRLGLELAIRDLARALKLGKTTPAAPTMPAAFQGSPAYVSLPGCRERSDSGEKAFSRCISEGSTRCSVFSREVTEDLPATGSPIRLQSK